MATLRLEIVTPEALTFSEDVDMVVVPGVEGQLGIYPMHVPLMTQLQPGEIKIFQGGKTTELVIGNGFVEIDQKSVSILTDVAAAEADIDETTVEAAVERAKEALQSQKLEPTEMAEAEAALARSMALLRFKRRRKHS
jgi:F-type H+-transporting ATPase subunit epsilon